MSTPLVTNIAPAAGTEGGVNESSRFSLRDADSEINRSTIQLYLGSGPALYRGDVLPENIDGRLILFEALLRAPNNPATRTIELGDLKIVKDQASTNQEGIYRLGGLEAPAGGEDSLMFEFTLNMDPTDIVPDGSDFSGILVGLWTNNSGLTVKFFTDGVVATAIELQGAAFGDTATIGTSAFDWAGEHTYKVLWHPELDLVKLYVLDATADADVLLITTTVSAFGVLPTNEQRANQPWLFFGHGYPIPTSISLWSDVFLHNIVTTPIVNGIVRGEHETLVLTNNEVNFDGNSLLTLADSAWQVFPASFGTLGGQALRSSGGLILERLVEAETLGFFRKEPKVTSPTVFDFQLFGELLTQDPAIDATGMEVYIDDGTKSVRFALLQGSDGVRYIGLLKDETAPGVLASYETAVADFTQPVNYRIIYRPGVSATLARIIPVGGDFLETEVLSVTDVELPPTFLPGPGLGILHNATAGNATARMTLLRARYSTSVELIEFDDFPVPTGWTKVGTGVAVVGTDVAALTDDSDTDNVHFEKAFSVTPAKGFSLEFRVGVVSYTIDNDTSVYDAEGLDPIRASTGVTAVVHDGTNRLAVVFVDAGPDIGKIALLLTKETVKEHLDAIRSGLPDVAGTYVSTDWTQRRIYRLVRSIGGYVQLFLDNAVVPALEIREHLFEYPSHGSGAARVEFGHDDEPGILTISEWSSIKFAMSDGFDIASKPVLTESEILSRFNQGVNVIVEAEDV